MSGYYEQFADDFIRFSPFSINRTGLIQNQTILRINDYMLICSPYQLSMKKAVLLLILSQEEIKFFRQYQNSVCLLGLVFQKSANTTPLNMDIQAKINNIGAVKGKQAVCMIDIEFTKQNTELVRILGEYISGFMALKEYFEQFKNKTITVNQETNQVLRYNNYAECFFSKMKVIGQLVSFSSNRLVFEFPALLKKSMPEKLKENNPMSAKLYFQLYRFIANGKIIKSDSLKENVITVAMAVDFIPELVEIMDDYFYRVKLEK